MNQGTLPIMPQPLTKYDFTVSSGRNVLQNWSFLKRMKPEEFFVGKSPVGSVFHFPELKDQK